MTIGGKVFSSPFEVKADPDTHFTQAELEESYVFSTKYIHELSNIDVALNNLDDLKEQLEKIKTAATAKNDSAATAAVDAALKQRDALQERLTANYNGFEDFLQRPGTLREDVISVLNQATLITPAVRTYGERTDAQYARAQSAYRTYIAALTPLNATLAKSGLTTVDFPKGSL
jgi:hypothetical protein